MDDQEDDKPMIDNHTAANKQKAYLSLLIMLIIGLVFLLSAVKIKADRAHAVNRRDPAAVLQAYFDAWERNDWATQASLLDQKYPNIVPEPVKSLNVIEIQTLSSQPTEKVYAVTFEIEVKGEGVSMHSGQYGWTFYISHDPKRDEWVITNYGEG